MFGKNKVLTYNPKDYEDQFSEGQKNDLRLTNNLGKQNSNPIGKLLNKNTLSQEENFITGWANKLDSFVKEKLTKLMEMENVVIDKDMRKLLEKIIGIKPKTKLLICVIAFLLLIFNPGLIVFAMIFIIFVSIKYTEATKREEIRKKMEKEKEEMLNKNNFN